MSLKKDINFFYRGNDMPKNHIIISQAKFKGTPSKKEDILLKQKRLLDEKYHNQAKLKLAEVHLKILKI